MTLNRNSKLENRNSESETCRVGYIPAVPRRPRATVCRSRGGGNPLGLAFLLAALILAAPPASAQVATGLPPFGSFSGGPDSVNNANLNVHWSMPVINKAGRGMPFFNTLSYDSSIWVPGGSSGSQYWTAQVPNFGWTGVLIGSTGLVYESSTTDYCMVGKIEYPYIYYYFGPYVDVQGSTHSLHVTTTMGSTQCNIPAVSSGTSTAYDGSGYTLVVTNTLSASIVLPSGETIVPPVYKGMAPPTSGSWSVTDTNGNEQTATLSSGTVTITDTLGTTALTISGSGTPSSPTTFTYTAASGNQATVTMNYTAYTVATNFGCSGITEFGATSESLVSSIVFPDGTSYGFTYEVTPGDTHNPHYVTGRPASVTLPTGGTISYSYSGGSNGITCADGSTATLARTTPDGTWTYAHSENGTAWTTTLTDPQSNVTTLNFQGIYETERQVASLETIYTCYNGASSPCNSTSITLPITQRTVTTSIGGLESEVNTDYNSYGLVTEVDQYGYGSGAVGSLVQKAVTAYNTSLNNYIVNRPATISLYNGAGTLLRQGSYSYDGGSLTATSGTPQHYNPTGSRGNLTSLTISGSGFGNVSKSVTYFDTGGNYVVTDFNNAQTTFNDGTGACGNTFATTIGLPMSLSRSVSWNCNGGLKSSSTDVNGNTTSFSYDNMNRLIQTSYPDGGLSQVQYTSATEHDFCTLISGSVSTFCVPNAGSLARHDETILDGLGRTIHQDLVSDPSGETYVDTTYDSLGRLYTRSNPYRSASDPTYGKDTNSYDAQGNLTSVVQGSETRSYTYDGLSRLTQATTPEGGTTYYYYTASGGSLCANNQRLVCRRTDARGITTTYTYDALDRLTGKSYSNGDPTVSYYYDQSSYNGLTISNGKGQRTGMSDGSGQTAWSYDTMGRMLAEERTIASITKTLAYSYNLDGSRASITYPSGRVLSYSYGDDARPLSVVDSANSINYATSATYAPPGGLANVVSGETGSFSGITTSNGYNNRLFPTALGASSSNGTALSLSYTYFANGNVNVETNGRDNGRTATYTYDSLNRVSAASSQATSGSDCWGQSFSYDRYANLTTIGVTQCSAPSLSLSVNTNNQITNSGFSYDASGDLTADGVYTYNWNGEQHLNSAAGVTYTYDGDLRRVEKSSGTLYWYCASCGSVLAESDLSGNIISEYTYLNNQRIARRDVSSGNVYYIFSDRLGSYRTLTDSSGNVKGESDYYPFGAERVISSTVTDNFRFAGMEWDSEDGLNHTLYRLYTPAQCRWESTDPARGCVNFPQGQNLYAYVRDNPTNRNDPNGNIEAIPPCNPSCSDFMFNLQNPDVCPSWCPPDMGGEDDGGGGAGDGSNSWNSWSLSYPQECTCTRLKMKPIRRTCWFICECNDGAIGFGDFTVSQLTPMCGPGVQFFCPEQITTLSTVYLWPPDIFVWVKPVIIGCKMF